MGLLQACDLAQATTGIGLRKEAVKVPYVTEDYRVIWQRLVDIEEFKVVDTEHAWQVEWNTEYGRQEP